MAATGTDTGTDTDSSTVSNTDGSTDRDRFMTEYLAGMPDSLTAQAAPVDGPARQAPRAATVDSIALGGQILGADGPVRGWVTVEGGVITGIGPRKPGAARTVATDGVIMPGMLDLHGHPEFNVFAPWEPPKSYLNRYAWRDSDAYRSLIRDPQNQLLKDLPTGTQLRYAEIRSLVGGHHRHPGREPEDAGQDGVPGPQRRRRDLRRAPRPQPHRPAVRADLPRRGRPRPHPRRDRRERGGRVLRAPRGGQA